MKLRLAASALLILGAAFLLSTCTAGGGSIFYTIENEQKTGSSTMPDYLVIADIAVVSSGSTYYVAAGPVFKGTMSGTPASMTWDPNSDSATTYRPYNPAYNGSAMLCNALAYWSTYSNLYGGFLTSDGEHVGLYAAASSSPVTANWSQLSLPSGSSEQPTYLQVVNTSYLFVGGTVVATSGSTYELDYSTDGATFTQCSGLSSLDKPVNGVVTDGTYYYVSTADAVYRTSLSGFSSGSTWTSLALSPVLGSTATPDQINGMYADGTTVYLLTKKSGIYTCTSSTSQFTQLVAAPEPSTNVYVSFLSMAKPYGSTGAYLVGADGYGYYILSGTTLTRYADTSVALYVESVSRIIIDGSNVFMGTNATGLWGAQMDSSGDLTTTWTHEQKS